MARLARVTQKIFGGSAANNGVFGSAQAGTPTVSASIATIMAGAAWLSGWLSATLGASKFPALEEFQGVEYVHSSQIAYILQQGIPEYDAGTTYYTKNMVINPGTYQIYGSVTDGQIGNPLSDAVNWKLLVDLSAISTGNTFYNGGTSTGSANAQVCASVTPSGFTLTNGFTLTFIAGFTNTGAMTMNANATGATAVYKNSGAGPVVLTGSEVTAGNTISITYNSTIAKYVITNSGGLLAANNLSDVQSAATSLSNLGGVPTARTITAAGLVTGGGDLTANRTVTVTAAIKSDQVTGTSNTVAVTPAVQQNHKSAVKSWANFVGATGVVNASYNVSSITRNGAGDYTVNLASAMADVNYVVTAACIPPSGETGLGNIFMVSYEITSLAVGSYRVQFFEYRGTSNVKAAVDPQIVCINSVGNM